MKLIVLYGPPASGKLTIARELAARTGYKLLHNHQTFDLLEPVFGAYHPEFAPLLNRLRLEIVRTAAAAGLDGLILTHVYGPEEAGFMQALDQAAAGDGHQARFVRLTVHPDELGRRVVHPARREFKKLATAVELRRLMADWDVTREVPGLVSLTIDNTHLSAAEVADQLMEQLRLPFLR